MSNIWLDAAPDAVLAGLSPGAPGFGHAFAIARADGLVQIGHCADPLAMLRKALKEAERPNSPRPTRCVISVAHREQWKSEFHLHNRFAPLRRFGALFDVPIDDVVAALDALSLDRRA